MHLSLSSVVSKAEYKKIKAEQNKFSAHAHPKVYDWNWKSKNFNRIALVNHLIASTGGWQSNYLEIGCAENDLFDAVAAEKKTGVDPAQGGTHRMTSDDFFRSNTDEFDVIFIDGLHEYQQVRRDALNALQVVKAGGWIAFHDFLPSSWLEHHVPQLQGMWTGDCWKLAVELAEAEGVEFRILEIDNGVGLMKKTSNDWNVPNMSEELLNAEFDVFVEKVQKFPLIDFAEAISFIEN